MALGIMVPVLLMSLGIACSSSSDREKPGGIIPSDSDADTDSDADSDADSDGDSDADGDSGSNLPPNTWIEYDKYTPDPNNCGEVILAVFRDFKAEHPDFQRVNLGWGPLQGVVDEQLGSDDKPRFNSTWGVNQVVDSGCQETCPTGGDLDGANLVSTQGWEENWYNSAQNEEQYDIPVPMYDGSSSFSDWYNTVDDVNKEVRKWLTLEKQSDGSYVFDSNSFFPIGDEEGWGVESGQRDEDGESHNFLFTTEVHLEFTYAGGERFTFRGDDDLWIFVNDHLALDLGGMHWPFEGTIDFDKKAKTLEIEKGGTYKMDIFHAERHTEASNFRIETDINCFVVVEVE